MQQGAPFIVTLNTTAVTGYPGQCRLPKQWRFHAWGHNRRETLRITI